MKKFLFILISVFILQSCASISKVPNKESKAVVGMGLSGTKDGGSWDPKVGGLAGIETQIFSCGSSSSITFGLLLILQGAAYTEKLEPKHVLHEASVKSVSVYESELSGKVSLTYIDFPVMYNYQSENGFYAEVGLQPGFLIGAKDKFDGGSYDYKESIKSFELGLPVGVGYQINEQISVGLRGCYGLTNANNIDNGDKDHNYTVFGVVRYNFGSLFAN